MSVSSEQPKRNRSYILTTEGLRKLHQGIRDREIQEKDGIKYSHEDLNEITGISSKTVGKVLAAEEGVDKSTIDRFYRAFQLELTEKDFIPVSQARLLKQRATEDEELPPFISDNPIIHPVKFFGREREINRIFKILKPRTIQNAAIIGKRRSGKTSLLQYLKNITTTPAEQLRDGQKYHWLQYPERYCWIFVDFRDSRRQSREGFMRYILEEMKLPIPNPCDLDRFMEVVSDNLRSPTVILLDELGVAIKRCPELDNYFWDSLRTLQRNNLGFVLAASESPVDLAHQAGYTSPILSDFGYTVTLEPLTKGEAQELIASSPIPFSEDDIEWILAQSRRWPILLQILCRERFFSLQDGETDDNWREEGLQQIKPFVHLLETD